jgi:UDP-N-acetylglucosamine 4-epimerase
MLQNALRAKDPTLPDQSPIYRDFRPGDVRHSLADIGKARHLLGFTPGHSVESGLELAMDWYRRNLT